jgi:hypothetical protein
MFNTLVIPPCDYIIIIIINSFQDEFKKYYVKYNDFIYIYKELLQTADNDDKIMVLSGLNTDIIFEKLRNLIKLSEPKDNFKVGNV